ncbi:MAG: DUF2269 family protein [Solirubrobacterales bacterium]
MTAYDLYVTIHVSGAVAWVGGNTVTQINGRRIVARNNAAELQPFVSDLVWLTPRFFIPISLLTVAFGAISVWQGPWSFSDPWVDTGLTMFVISFLIGIAMLSPTAEQLEQLAGDDKADSPEYTKKVSFLLLWSAIELVLLWATVFVMVLKPG